MPQISAKQLGKALLNEVTKIAPEKVDRALFRAAHRGRNLLIKRTPADQGIARNAWEAPQKVVVHTAAGGFQEGYEVRNTAPHIGILELGSRPHMPPVQPLYEWVKRNIGQELKATARLVAALAGRRSIGKRGVVTQAQLIDKRAMALAWAIAMTIKKKGTKPLFIVKGALPQLRKYVQQEIRREFTPGG
jgi:hypothetical protein